ncbi:DUF4124 domain-containing protein [Ottowia sp.]|uniref:DUF4124 domain-containing protein n=1 Tax=Ottowia sp. TaxID=1898956 RepID=UPI0026350608|nr:DUF4124 domain-containing protein [Ottowia sp.]
MKYYFRVLFFGAALAVSLAASAQYQWIDKDGRRVFSDRPPPADVPAKNILKQPHAARVPAQTLPVSAEALPEGAAAAKPVAAASAPGGVDKSLEEKKKQAEAAEAAKKKDAEAKQAAQKADNCKRAQEAKATLDSGMRIARLNANGEREVLDDQARAVEMKRAQDIISADCK